MVYPVFHLTQPLNTMKQDEINIVKELRLLICSWCFGVAMWLAPKDDPEGLIIVEFIGKWAAAAKTYLIAHAADPKKPGR